MSNATQLWTSTTERIDTLHDTMACQICYIEEEILNCTTIKLYTECWLEESIWVSGIGPFRYPILSSLGVESQHSSSSSLALLQIIRQVQWRNTHLCQAPSRRYTLRLLDSYIFVRRRFETYITDI